MNWTKLIIILLICITDVYSQSNDLKDTSISSVKLNSNSLNSSDTSSTCTITMNSRSVYKDVQMFGLKDSTLGILKDEKSVRLNVSDIRTIKFDAKGFWTGALYGGTAGFLAGFAIGLLEGFDFSGHGGSGNVKFGQGVAAGIFLAVPFGLIGGGVGSLLANDHLYDMSGYSFIKKRSLIYFLIKEH